MVLPKSTAEHACSIGVSYDRMTTTDSDLRVEYFKGGPYGRVYAVPSAHPELDWTPLGGYPQLGYLIRFGACTDLSCGRLLLVRGHRRPAAALSTLRSRSCPIHGPGNFGIAHAAQLAEDIRARWLVPMHYGRLRRNQDEEIDRFVDLYARISPPRGIQSFRAGERWMIP